MIIRSRSPVRVSFGGGGTDVPPYCDEHGGCVVSATINKYAFATLKTRHDQEIHLHSQDFLKDLQFGHVNDLMYNNELDLIKAVIKKFNTTGMGLDVTLRVEVPPKSGLGSSAAAFAALIGLFNHMKREKKMTEFELAELAYQLERTELMVGGGKQDQFATVFGGINFIEFKDGAVRVNPLRIKRDHILELEKHLVLAYTEPRKTNHGGDIIEDQRKSIIEKKNEVIEAHHKIKELANEIRYALLRGDFERFGALLHEAWQEKKKNSKMITSEMIDTIYDVARKHGALGGKISGAGGGGFMFFLCDENREHDVARAIERAGAKPVPFTFDMNGLETWEVIK